MSAGDWHIEEDDLRAYADGTARPPWLWSTEAHLAACPGCKLLNAVTKVARRK